jgi:3-hydroxybutyryl-CoA dehydrogenase
VTPGRIRTSTQLDEIASEADLVIEAVFENLEVKQGIFRKLDELCPQRTILASNTSAILPSKLAMVTQHPERVLVVHYWNPPYLVPLVEIVRHAGTSDETVATLHELLSKMGKSPAIVQKEAVGFIGNRLQAALLREAISLVEKGIASPQDVDIVIRNGPGRRWAAAGIFEIADIGNLMAVPSLGYLLAELESSTEIPGLWKDKVARGELGVKTGKGFFPMSTGGSVF